MFKLLDQRGQKPPLPYPDNVPGLAATHPPGGAGLRCFAGGKEDPVRLAARTVDDDTVPHVGLRVAT